MRLMLLLLIFCSSMLYASIGTITSLEGKATIKRGEESLIALLGNEIEKKDIISTQENSKVKITLNDNTIISIGKESTLNIEEYVYDTTTPSDSKTELNFVKGAFHTITGQIGKINPSKFKLKTKSASIGIRGTEIYGDETSVACTKGIIEVTSFGVTYIIPSGNFIDTFINKAPSTLKKLDTDSLNKIKNKLQINKTNKDITFTTKNSNSKKGTTSANAKNGTVTIKKDGTVTYTPKDGFKGSDTVTITRIDGDETITETITINVSDNLEIPTELNLESITTTFLGELINSSILNDNQASNDVTLNQFNAQELDDFGNKVNETTKNQTAETPAAENPTVENPTVENPTVENPTVATIATLSILEGTSLQTGSLPTISNTNSSILTYITNTTIAGFSLDSDGTYSFDGTNSAYDNLNRRESQTLTIPITAIDDTGLSTTSNLKIVVEGNSDLSGYQLAALINTDINKTTQVNNSTLLGPSKMNVYTDKVVLGEYNLNYLSKYYSSDILVNTTTASNQTEPSITSLGSDKFIVTWNSNDGSNEGIYGQIFNSNGTKNGNEFLVNTTTSSVQVDSSITALSDTKFIVTWSSYFQDGSYFGIYGQVFNSDGTKSGSEFRVNTTTADHQTESTITALGSNKFIVTWTSDNQDGYNSGVYGQIFNSSGTKISSQFLVNTTIINSQSQSSITALGSNTFIVTWISYYQDGDAYGVYGQIFNSNGTKNGNEFLVNTTTTNTQSQPTITTLGSDKFIITWRSYGQDNADESSGVYGQIFYNNGIKIGSEFLVNTTTANDQYKPTITSLGSDKFIVTWTSDGQDNADGSLGVYGQIFNSDGTKNGSEFLVNTTTAENQYESTITSLGSDKFIVTWTSYGQDGSGAGVYSQIFIIKDGVVKSGELSYASFDLSGYTSHSDIGNIAFSQTINDTPYSGTYILHSDNLGEFIVGYADETWTIDGEEHSYKDLFYNGLVSSSSVLDNTKIYTYSGYKSLIVDSYLGDSVSGVSLNDISSSVLKINAKTASISIRDYANIQDSGWEFTSSKLNTDGSISSVSYQKNVDVVEEDTLSSESTVTGQLYGSEGQGIGINGDETNYSSSGDISNTSKFSETYFLDSSSTNPTNEEASFSGLSTLIYKSYNFSDDWWDNYSSDPSNTIKFDLNRNIGSITNGMINWWGSEFRFSGTVDNLSSYYINDDNFGVRIENYYRNEGDTYSLIENSAWMVAIPDKVNTDGTLSENLDNESSWGYWTADLNNSSTLTNISAYSTWVAGIQTDPDYVQALIDSSSIKTLNFEGHIIGAVTNAGNIDAIKLDTNNFMDMEFKLGAATNNFTGAFGFNTSAGNSWSGDVSGAVTASGFSGGANNVFVNTVAPSYIESGIEGQFYGTNEIKSVGGTIDIDSPAGDLSGSFKADKVGEN
jgi:VCBS repeat-containing protein